MTERRQIATISHDGYSFSSLCRRVFSGNPFFDRLQLGYHRPVRATDMPVFTIDGHVMLSLQWGNYKTDDWPILARDIRIAIACLQDLERRVSEHRGHAVLAQGELTNRLERMAIDATGIVSGDEVRKDPEWQIAVREMLERAVRRITRG